MHLLKCLQILHASNKCFFKSSCPFIAFHFPSRFILTFLKQTNKQTNKLFFKPEISLKMARGPARVVARAGPS